MPFTAGKHIGIYQSKSRKTAIFVTIPDPDKG